MRKRLSFAALMQILLLPAGLSIGGSVWASTVADGESAIPIAIQRVSAPRVVGRVRPVNGVTIRVGHASLRLNSGTIAEIRSKSDLLGHYFQGDAEFEYVSENPEERDLLQFNANRNSSLRIQVDPAQIRVKESIKEAALWMANLEFAGGQGEGVPGDEETLNWNLNNIGKLFGRRYHDVPGHRLAAHLANASNEPFARLDLKGKSNHLSYSYDPAGARNEDLTLSNTQGRIDLSSQAIGRKFFEIPVPAFTLIHLDLDLTATGGKSAKMVVKERYVAAAPARKAMLLNLFSDAFAQGNYFLKVRSIRTAGGQAVPFDHISTGSLFIELPEAPKPDQPFELKFEIDGDILQQIQGDNVWQLGIGPWFPQPDIGGQYFTVAATVRTPKPFIPVMPGTLVNREQVGGVNVCSVRIDKPIQFFVVDAGKYGIHQDKRDGKVVRVFTYENEGRNQERIANLTHQIIKLYESWFGPFPFPEFNVIQQLAYGYGQAPPGTMYITLEAFNSLADDIARVVVKGINDRIAHEIAHQYWGHVLKMSDPRDQWLTESFAEYSSGLAMMKAKGKGESYFAEKVERWKRDADAVKSKSSIATANDVASPSPGEAMVARTGLLYSKGAYLLAVIHRRIGDDHFMTLMKALLESRKFDFGYTTDVINLLKIITKEDYWDFFMNNFWGTGMPELPKKR